MRFLHLSIFLSSSLAAAQELRADDRLNEVVYLANCKFYNRNDKTPSGGRDRMWYYKSVDDSMKNGRELPVPDNSVTPHTDAPQRTDGFYSELDWTIGTISQPIEGKLDGREFKVWSLDTKGDPRSNVTGEATLDGHSFRCYSSPHMKRSKDADNGKSHYDCTTKYFCTRAERKIRRTKFTFTKATMIVPIETIRQDQADAGDGSVKDTLRDAFQELQKAVDDNAASSEPFRIGNSTYSFLFTIDRAEHPGDALYDPHRIQDIINLLNEKLVPEIMKHDETKPIGNFVLPWHTRHSVPVPREIKVQVQLADQVNPEWTDQDTITITTVYTGNGKKGLCESQNPISTVLAGLFSLAALAGGAFGAAAAGLGALETIVAGGVCV